MAPPPAPGKVAPLPYYGATDTRSEFDKGVDIQRGLEEQDAADEALKGQLLEWQAKNNDLAPGTSAEIAKYAAALRLDPQVVRDNLAAIQKDAAYKLPWQQIAEDHPILSKFIGDPELGPAAIQDAAALSGIEALVGRWETRPADLSELGAINEMQPPSAEESRKSLTLKYPGVVQSLLARGWDQLLLDLNSAVKLTGLARLNMLLDPAQAGKTVDELARGKSISDAAASAWQRNTELQNGVIDRLNGELAGAKNIVGDVRAFGPAGRAVIHAAADALEMVPMILGQAAITAATGAAGPAAMWGGNAIYNFSLTSGGIYNRFSLYKDPETGKTFSETQKTLAALAGGSVSAAVMSGTTAKITAEQLNLLGARVLPEAYGRTAQAVLRSPDLLSTLGLVGKQAGIHVLEGASVMAAASGIEAATEELGKSYAFGATADPAVVAKTAALGFYNALRTLPFLVSFGPSRAVIEHLGRAKRAERNAALIDGLIKSRQESKAPDLQEEFTRQAAAAQDGNPRAAFINRATWDAEMQAQGVDPRAVHAELVGDKGETYDRAVKSFSADLEIPIEKVGRLGKSEALSDFAVRELRAYQADSSIGDVIRSSTQLADRMQEILKDVSGDPEAAVRKAIEDRVGPMLDEIANKYPEAQRDYPGHTHITEDKRPTILKGLVDWMFADTVATYARVPPGTYPDLHTFFNDYYDNTIFATLTTLKQARETAVRSLLQGLGGVDISGQNPFGGPGTLGAVLGPGPGAPETVYSLFKPADPTTPFHEWMHLQTWLKQVLLDKLQARGVSAPLLAEHYRNMLALMESPAGFREKVVHGGQGTQAEINQYFASEEKLAHLFEEYLLRNREPPDLLVAESLPALQVLLRASVRGLHTPEGFAEHRLSGRQAPTGESLASLLRSAKLTPEMVAWFDSLVSSEASVEAAGRSVSVMPLDKVVEGLPESVRQAYLEASERTRETARRAVVAIIQQARRRNTQEWVTNSREQVKKVVSNTLAKTNAYRAIEFLTKGKTDFFPYDEHFKLDPAEFKRDYPTMFGLVEKNHPEILAKQGEVSHDLETASAELRYSDKASMVRDLAMLGDAPRPKFGDAVEQYTEARLQDLFGSLYKPSPDDLAREALDTMTHSKSLFEKALIELRWIAEQSGKAELRQRSSLLGNDTARALARDAMNQRGWYGFRPDEFLRAERRYAEKAFVALEAGDMAEAYSMKEAQLFNQLFYSEARKAEAALKANMSRLRSNARDDSYRQALGRAGNGVGDGMGFVNIFDAITNALGVTQRPLAGDPLSGFLEVVGAKLPPGMLVFDPAGLADALARLRASSPTVGDVAMLNLVVRNIEGLAKLVNSETMKTREAKYNDIRGGMMQDMQRLPPKPPDTFREGRDQTFGRSVKKGVEAIDAALLDPEVLVEMVGPTAHKYIFKPFLDAKARENTLRKEVLAWVQKTFDEMPQGSRKLRDTVIPELEADLPIDPSIATTRTGPRDHGWLWMVALNFGNVRNRQRLLDGFGWTADAVLRALDKHLTAPEWDLIESIWKHLDTTLWPAIAEKEKRFRGLPPDKEEAVPFTLSSGREIRGGYFPLRYDPKSQRGLVKGVEAALEGREIDMPMVTPHGFVYKRADRFVDLPWLAWHVVPSHINQVVHDVAFGEYMYDMRRLLADPVLQTALESRMGTAHKQNVMAWLGNVAMNGSEAVAQHQQVLVNTVMGTARSWFVNATLGLSFPVVAADFLNPLVAALGKQITFRDLATSFAVTPGAVDFVASKSPYMADRRNNFLSGFQEQLLKIGASTRRRAINDVLYSLMDGLDKLTSTTIWLAKYKEVVREARAGEITPELEAKAVDAADYAVRRSLPSDSLLERSAILRDRRTLGMLIIFYSWFNKTYNMARQVTHDPYIDFVNAPGAKTGATLAGAVGRALALLFVSGALGDYVSGRGREQDETWGQYWARKAIAAPFTALPLVSGAVDYAAGRAITGKAKQMSVRSAPIMSSIQSIMQQLGNAANDRHYPEDRFNDLVSLGLTVGGLPAAQYRRTVGYASRLATGHENPRNISEAAGGLLYGTNPYGQKPSNPATDLGEVLR